MAGVDFTHSFMHRLWALIMTVCEQFVRKSLIQVQVVRGRLGAASLPTRTLGTGDDDTESRAVVDKQQLYRGLWIFQVAQSSVEDCGDGTISGSVRPGSELIRVKGTREAVFDMV